MNDISELTSDEIRLLIGEQQIVIARLIKTMRELRSEIERLKAQVNV